MALPKLNEMIEKVNDSVTVYRYDNGWMVELSGEDSSEEWVTKKLVCPDLKNVLTLLEEYSKIKLR
jgi:hypothetical protein